MVYNPWVDPQIASKCMGVSENTLSLWRNIGYLKYGTHWRKSYCLRLENKKEAILYHLDWCKEEMEYWKSRNAIIEVVAA